MTVGNMQYGSSNNADTDNTQLSSIADATLRVTNAHSPIGNAVVGETATGLGVYGTSDNHIGVAGNGKASGVYGESVGGSGVYGASSKHVGVYGESSNLVGVYGTSHGGDGIKGWVQGPNASGVLGVSGDGYGVTGEAAGDGIGVRATAYRGFGLVADTKKGNIAILATNYQEGPVYGVYAATPSSSGVAVYGTGGGTGVLGWTGTGNGVMGVSNGTMGSDTGVRGEARGIGGTGVAGVSDKGRNAWGVYGQSAEGKAGVFSGDVLVAGSLSKQAGGFLIDHVLDAANKYLSHSFVESPEMLNVYSGNATTDARGDATIVLPDYFEALNRDYRYQLTVVGQFAQAIVAEEIHGGQFRIRTDKPNVKVSWQVTGIRQDAYAKAHPLIVEVDKPDDERGTYLSPREHNQPETLGTFYKRTHAAEEQNRRLPVDLDHEEIRAIVERDRLIAAPIQPPYGVPPISKETQPSDGQ